MPDDRATDPTKPTGPVDRPRRFPLEAVPTWLQALAAVAAVIVTAVGVFGIAGPRPAGDASASAAVPSAPARVAVVLESVTTDPTAVRASGTYEHLDPATEVILFVGQPVADPGADWLPVVATLAASATADDGRQSGRWEASRPTTAPGTRFTWYAVVAPRAAGAGDPYADLRADGPTSDLVKAASAAVTTDG